MGNFQRVVKNGCAFLVVGAAIVVVGTSSARADSYTYSLTNSVVGSITTSCDNCVLNTSDITAWSLSEPGFLSVSSTTPGAKLTVPAGDTDMVANAGGIDFNFHGPSGSFQFSAPSGSFYYEDVGPSGNIGFGPQQGIIAACPSSATPCNFIVPSTDGVIAKASTTSTSAPEVDPASVVSALTVLLGLLAVTRGRRQRTPLRA